MRKSWLSTIVVLGLLVFALASEAAIPKKSRPVNKPVLSQIFLKKPSQVKDILGPARPLRKTVDKNYVIYRKAIKVRYNKKKQATAFKFRFKKGVNSKQALRHIGINPKKVAKPKVRRIGGEKVLYWGKGRKINFRGKKLAAIFKPKSQTLELKLTR